MAASVVLITVSFENSPIEYSIENYSNPLDIEFALHCMVGLYRFLLELYDSEKNGVAGGQGEFLFSAG